VTNRKLLYVNKNYTTRLLGVTEAENDVLLPFLLERVKDPAYQVRFRWSPGAVAFWDNRATQHYAVPDYPGRRCMHRVVIQGDKPY
jgi:taurine dioxygenase